MFSVYYFDIKFKYYLGFIRWETKTLNWTISLLCYLWHNSLTA